MSYLRLKVRYFHRSENRWIRRALRASDPENRHPDCTNTRALTRALHFNLISELVNAERSAICTIEC